MPLSHKNNNNMGAQQRELNKPVLVITNFLFFWWKFLGDKYDFCQWEDTQHFSLHIVNNLAKTLQTYIVLRWISKVKFCTEKQHLDKLYRFIVGDLKWKKLLSIL